MNTYLANGNNERTIMAVLCFILTYNLLSKLIHAPTTYHLLTFYTDPLDNVGFENQIYDTNDSLPRLSPEIGKLTVLLVNR